MSTSAIECVALTMRLGGATVLEDIAFEAREGESLAILGHNGAGKSTLLRVLSGLTRRYEGECRIEGYDVRKHRIRLSTLVGYMPDKSNLYNHRSVLQNLLFHGTIRGCSGEVLSQRVSSALLETDTSHIRDRKVGELSAGWRKMAQLACAMIHRPRVLLLDEPCAGLDWAARNRLWHIVRRFEANAATIVVATQQALDALECDWAVVLAKGCVVAKGTMGSLTPSHGCEVPVVVQTRLDQEKASGLREHANVLAAVEHPPDIRIVFADESAAKRAIEELDVSNADFTIVSASFEEIYLGVTSSCLKDRESAGIQPEGESQPC